MFGDGRTVFLENLSLFRGEKCLFSCVSHEVFSLYHMAYADDSLKDSILSAADSTIKDLPLYGQMQKIASELKVKPEVELEKEMRILLDLCWYVDGEKKYVFRMVPEYECDFQTFKKIAKTWLTEGTSSVLLPSAASPICSLFPFRNGGRHSALHRESGSAISGKRILCQCQTRSNHAEISFGETIGTRGSMMDQFLFIKQ